MAISYKRRAKLQMTLSVSCD